LMTFLLQANRQRKKRLNIAARTVSEDGNIHTTILHDGGMNGHRHLTSW
jgi:hypothetical protein